MAGRWFRRRADRGAPRPSPDEDWERISGGLRRAKSERQAQLSGREALVAEVSAILFEADPIGINFETNSDEYEAEAETIILRLDEASGPEDVQRIAHEEFVRWFDSGTAGAEARYAGVGREIWRAANRKALG